MQSSRRPKGLNDSIWASRSSCRNSSSAPRTLPNLPPSTTSAITPVATSTASYNTSNRPLSPAQELERFRKIATRVNWKLSFLGAAWQMAIAKPGSEHYPLNPVLAAEREQMFKLDFFEYYMLLERALVHLLGVFGIGVSRDFHTLLEQRDGGGATNDRPAVHAYHQNVLAALDDPENPLHEAMGQGEVRRCLQRAKDLRNRWKYADDLSEPGKENNSSRNAQPVPLENYDLENILTTIFIGFDVGLSIAQQRVAEETNGRGANGIEAEKEEEPWDFMVDAMDWEAV